MGFDESKINRDALGKFSSGVDRARAKVNDASAKLRSINPKTHAASFKAQHKEFQAAFKEYQQAQIDEAKSLPKRPLVPGKQNKKFK
jgi:hypothetical protein